MGDNEKGLLVVDEKGFESNDDVESGDGDISVLGGNDHDDVLGGDVYDDVLGGGGVAVQEKFQSSVSEGIPGSEQVLKIHHALIIIKF